MAKAFLKMKRWPTANGGPVVLTFKFESETKAESIAALLPASEIAMLEELDRRLKLPKKWRQTMKYRPKSLTDLQASIRLLRPQQQDRHPDAVPDPARRAAQK